MKGAASHTHVAIVGTGFGGLGAAIRLKQEGVTDFVIFERGHDVGGVWRDNTYPGCACDVESHLYSFSFAPNPDWTRSFSPQPEILAYLQRCARDYGILPYVRFGHAVTKAAWDTSAKLWRIETSRGAFTADVLIAGMGGLSEPATPKIPGLERFEGKAFHSARWDHERALAGRKVAVLGTGASSIQIVPAIQPEVSKLYVFQRTPAWVIPRYDRAISELERSLFRALPFTERLTRASVYARRELFVLGFRNPTVMRLLEKLALRYLEESVRNPVLRQKLTPDFRLGCKRILISRDYLPALTQDNVDVVTSGIREIRARSIVTDDGAEHEVDTIIFSTGFQVTDPPFGKLIYGAEGRTLSDVWAGSPEAHLGTMVAGFPNLFLLTGPNTGLGHSSMVYMIESQIGLILHALEHLRDRDLASLEPTREAQARWLADVEKRTKGTVWTAGGCASWYLDANGRNSTLWPSFTFLYRWRTARFRPSDYRCEKRGPSAVSLKNAPFGSRPAPLTN